ncbi:MAG: hydrogenase/urease maturation nickel metallochaperone HypA [Acidimicrobiia bacterium]
MHERGLVSKTAADLASSVGSTPVRQVTLALAPETDRDVVLDAWSSATAGSEISRAELICITKDHGLQCLDCGHQYLGDKLKPCPQCGGNGLIVEPTPDVAVAGWVAGGGV